MTTPDTPEAPTNGQAPSQPSQVVGQLYILNPSEINERERASLVASGRDPDDFCLMIVPALQMQAVAQQDAGGQVVIVFQIAAAVAHAILPFPLRGIVDAQGNTPTGARARDALPLAPEVRLLVKRDALGPEVVAELDKARFLHSIGQPVGGTQS